MLLTFGKHQGRSVDEVVLKDPDYLLWMVRLPDPSDSMERVCDEARRLVGVFNSKPFLKTCAACQASATRISVYPGNVTPMYWCDHCNPYCCGAAPGRLLLLATYQDAVSHILVRTFYTKTEIKQILRRMSRAKGLPDRLGKRQAQEFFVM